MQASDKRKQSLVQFIKFGIVGISNTLLGYLIFCICVYLGLHHQLSNFIGFTISVLNSFYWNNRYVFTLNTGERRSKLHSLLKTYAAYSVTGIFLNGVLLWLLVDEWACNSYLAMFACLVITVPINFILNKFWAFKPHKP